MNVGEKDESCFRKRALKRRQQRTRGKERGKRQTEKEKTEKDFYKKSIKGQIKTDKGQRCRRKKEIDTEGVLHDREREREKITTEK